MRYPDEHADEHLDEGTIHVWLDEALAPDESRIIEAHVQGCERCSAAVAEARGLMAASSRILSALDDVPADVIPDSMGGAGDSRDQLAALRARHAAERAVVRRRWWRSPQFVAAASVAFVALGTATVTWRGSFRADALPEAPVARLESDRATASDAAAPLAPPAPTAVNAAGPRAVAGIEAPREGKVASAPAMTGSAAVRKSTDSANVRAEKSLLSDVVPTGVASRAAEPPAQAPPLQQTRTAPAAQQGMTEQQRPQVQQQLRLQAEDRMLQRSRAAAAQANEAPIPAAAAPARTDSAALAARIASLEALSFADAGCYHLSAPVTDEVLASAWPSGVRLDTARARAVGDTVWRRGVSLPPGAARELEWRRVDANTVELTWTGDVGEARVLRRVGLELPAPRVTGFSDVAGAATVRSATIAPGAVRAVRASCPR